MNFVRHIKLQDFASKKYFFIFTNRVIQKKWIHLLDLKNENGFGI